MIYYILEIFCSLVETLISKTSELLSILTVILLNCEFVRGVIRKPSQKSSSGELGAHTRQVWNSLLCGTRNRIRITFDANACVSRSPIITRRGMVDSALKRLLKTTFAHCTVYVCALGLRYRSRRFHPDFFQITY